jgi:hypothetical protein
MFAAIRRASSRANVASSRLKIEMTSTRRSIKRHLSARQSISAFAAESRNADLGLRPNQHIADHPRSRGGLSRGVGAEEVLRPIADIGYLIPGEDTLAGQQVD